MEILAPAGGTESLKAAINHGADAVYLGLNEFSARAKAENFTVESLPAAVDYAHLYGAKVYVTLNTLVKDCEMAGALKLLRAIENSKADAVILQDLGLSKIVAENSGIVMHASTQMGIHNAEGAAMAKKMGFSRVVVSRETSLEDIKKIISLGMEVEVFVQGALCVAFSGNCYLSSMLSGYSGNRGKCLQLCRKLYDIDGQKKYWLSPSDIMLAKKIEILRDANVTSLKIEGRMRRPEYVAASVDLYKKSLSGENIDGEICEVKKIYNRGNYNEAYLFEPTPDVIYPALQNHMGVHAGKITDISGKTFKSDCVLSAGNGYKILHNGSECGGALAIKNSNTSGYDGAAHVGDEIRLTTDKKSNEELLSVKRKIPVVAEVNFTADNTLLSLKCGNTTVTVIGEPMPVALNSPASDDDISKSVSKSGKTEFSVDFVKIQKDRPVFLLKGAFNELRRKAFDELKAKIIDNNNASVTANRRDKIVFDLFENVFDVNGLMVQIDDPDFDLKQFDECEYIAVNPLEYSLSYLKRFGHCEKFVLNLPLIARDSECKILKQIVDSGLFDKFIVNNLFGLQLCKGKKIIPGYGLNMINSVYDIPKINPFENDALPANSLPYIFGKLPLMTFCHCVNKTLKRDCASCNGYKTFLTDEKHKRFFVRRYRIKYCYGQLIAEEPFYFGYRDRGFIDLTGIAPRNYSEVMDKIKCGKYDINCGNIYRGLK